MTIRCLAIGPCTILHAVITVRFETRTERRRSLLRPVSKTPRRLVRSPGSSSAAKFRPKSCHKTKGMTSHLQSGAKADREGLRCNSSSQELNSGRKPVMNKKRMEFDKGGSWRPQLIPVADDRPGGEINESGFIATYSPQVAEGICVGFSERRFGNGLRWRCTILRQNRGGEQVFGPALRAAEKKLRSAPAT